MPSFTLVVLSNPVEGREDEYNDWYTNAHLADVLGVPGVVSAQRFRRTEQQRTAGPHAWKYMALFECEADEVRTVTDGMQARSGNPGWRSSALADELMVCFFEPITDVVRRVES